MEDARLGSFREDSYFKESEVVDEKTTQTEALLHALSRVKGIAVLKGESGLGKTHFLRYIAKHNPGTAVFLTANQCRGGVVEAIANKLLGFARDEDLLNSLVYNGALTIDIDEVSPDTRVRISEFLSRFNKARCLITTQPIDWPLPERVVTYRLLPLKKEKIKDFITSRPSQFDSSTSSITREDFLIRCDHFLSDSLDNKQLLKDEEALNQKVLSNPMDLSIVAHMLYHGRKPNLLNLQGEYYGLVANIYQDIHGTNFPIASFSEYVFEMRLKDKDFLPMDIYYREVQCMVEHKMVIITIEAFGEKRSKNGVSGTIKYGNTLSPNPFWPIPREQESISKTHAFEASTSC